MKPHIINGQCHCPICGQKIEPDSAGKYGCIWDDYAYQTQPEDTELLKLQEEFKL